MKFLILLSFLVATQHSYSQAPDVEFLKEFEFNSFVMTILNQKGDAEYQTTNIALAKVHGKNGPTYHWVISIKGVNENDPLTFSVENTIPMEGGFIYQCREKSNEKLTVMLVEDYDKAFSYEFDSMKGIKHTYFNRR